MRKIILLMIILLSTVSCAKEDEEIKKLFKIPENKKILEKQIHSGSRGEEGSFKKYTKKDLELLLQIEKIILKNRKYKPSKEKMEKNLQMLFKIQTHYEKCYSSDNYDMYESIGNVENNCKESVDNKRLKVYSPRETHESIRIFVSKKENIITQFVSLPYVIDYLEIDPELSKLEEWERKIPSDNGMEMVDVERWKDKENLKADREEYIKSFLEMNGVE